MVTINDIRALKDNDGLTIRKGNAVSYKSGWQVADRGIECRTPESCFKAVQDMGGDAGVWFSDGVYYVDHSFRVNTKHEAVKIGLANNQQSILKWSTMGLVWLK